MATENMPIIGPDWDGYSYLYGQGLLARVHFDTQVAGVSRTTHSECIRVILFIHPKRVRPDGQPNSAEEMQSLLDHQRQLVDQLTAGSVRCRLVGSMLYGGMFDLVFQAEARESARFKAVTADWARSASPYRVEVKQSPGWGFFDARVQPSPAHAQQIADRQAIQALIDAGADPTRRYQLGHRIKGSPDVLRKIARELEAKGFFGASFPAADALLIATVSPLDLMQIWDTTGRLVGYCAGLGARYDGWGAEVVAPGA